MCYHRKQLTVHSYKKHSNLCCISLTPILKIMHSLSFFRIKVWQTLSRIFTFIISSLNFLFPFPFFIIRPQWCSMWVRTCNFPLSRDANLIWGCSQITSHLKRGDIKNIMSERSVQTKILTTSVTSHHQTCYNEI